MKGRKVNLAFNEQISFGIKKKTKTLVCSREKLLRLGMVKRLFPRLCRTQNAVLLAVKQLIINLVGLNNLLMAFLLMNYVSQVAVSPWRRENLSFITNDLSRIKEPLKCGGRATQMTITSHILCSI